MEKQLILITFLILSLGSAHDTPIGDCLSCCITDEFQNTTRPNNETVAFKYGYNISVPMLTFCTHNAIYDFEVLYTLGTGDADSSFSMSYYEMQIDASGTCSSDPLATSGTLTASTKYSTTS